ncbi:MAG: 50S ribosomal protein L24 [Nanoarchaeota archaeon]|nr:50S ribosomal protein L24 [Nanoarchaeota archaeon]
MKNKFSNQWRASKQPRKQRKFVANAPLHIRHKMISANLSKELRKKYGKRNFSLRKGDSVKVMRGEFKGKTGKIEKVDVKKTLVLIAGIYRSKKDGTKINVNFHPSNLQIRELELEDKKRKESLERKMIKKEKPEVKENVLKKR